MNAILPSSQAAAAAALPAPIGLLAELTHRCPLRCTSSSRSRCAGESGSVVSARASSTRWSSGRRSEKTAMMRPDSEMSLSHSSAESMSKRSSSASALPFGNQAST